MVSFLSPAWKCPTQIRCLVGRLALHPDVRHIPSVFDNGLAGRQYAAPNICLL